MLAGLYSYTLIQWVLLFYFYCFFGWCFESTYVSLHEHRFVNRGFLRLPLLPIYGSGALCILLTCLPYRNSIPAVFVLGILFPTILEFLTGWAMEAMFKMRYWDYSDKRFNLCGYISLPSSLTWGGLSLLLIYVIHPPLGQLIQDVPPLISTVIVVPITLAFAVDFIVAFHTAINLRHFLEELERMRAQLDEARVQLELARETARDLLEQNSLQQHVEQLAQACRHQVVQMMKHYPVRALLRAHPSAMSHQFSKSLQLARERAVAFRRQVSQAVEKTAEGVRDTVEKTAEGVRDTIDNLKP